MKSSDMMVWALGLLEFEQPVLFESARDIAALQAQPPAELRLRVETYRDFDPALIVEVPLELWLRADDEAETIELTITTALEPHKASAAALSAVADATNRLGRCCATWHDAERGQLVIGSSIRHDLMFRDAADPQEAASIQKQMTARWLTSVAEVAVQAAASLAKQLTNEGAVSP